MRMQRFVATILTLISIIGIVPVCGADNLSAPQTAEMTNAVLVQPYEMVDISSAINSMLYLDAIQFYNTRNVNSDKWYRFKYAENMSDFLCWGTSYHIRMAFEREYIQEMLTEGVIKDKASVPYSMPLEGAINVQGSVNPSTTVDITDGNYKKIHFLAALYDGSYDHLRNLTVTLKYTDGTTVNFDKTSEILDHRASQDAENFVMAPELGMSNSAQKTEGESYVIVEPKTTLNVYTYAVNVDETRVLESIMFSSLHKTTNLKILAVTAVTDSVQGDIMLLPASNKITDENCLEVQSQIISIERRMSEESVTEKELEPYVAEKLNSVRAELFYKYKKFELIDMHEYATSKAYVDEDDTTFVRDNNHDYFMFGSSFDSYIHALSRSDLLKIIGENNTFMDMVSKIPYLIEDDGALTIQGNIYKPDYTDVSLEFNSVADIDMKKQKYESISFLAGIAESSSDINKKFSLTVEYMDGTQEYYDAGTSEELRLKSFNDSATERGYAFSLGGYITSSGKFTETDKEFNIFAYTINTDKNKEIVKIVFRSSHYGSNPKVFAITGLLGKTLFEKAHSADGIQIEQAASYSRDIDDAYEAATKAINNGWAEASEFDTLFNLKAAIDASDIIVSGSGIAENEEGKIFGNLHTLKNGNIPYVLVAAAYNADGSLYDIRQISNQNIAYTDGVSRYEISVNKPNGGYVSCFIWDSLNSLTPLSRGVWNEEYVIYVSPEGDDSNNGSKENPVRSFQRAKELVALRQDKTKRTRVIFGEGTYRVEDTITFSAEDAGSETAPVIYQAARGERVVFSGAKNLNVADFDEIVDADVLARIQDSSKGKVKALNLADSGITAEMIGEIDFDNWYNNLHNEYTDLFLNSKEQPLSQWPNGQNDYAVYGYVINEGSDGGAVFTYSGDAPDRWTTATDWYFYGFPSSEYSIDRIKGGAINQTFNTVTLAEKGVFEFSASGSKRWKAFNLLEEIDMPGEWYIDKENLVLYYYVPENAQAEDALELSVLQKPMLSFDNDRTEYNITFDGIEFAMSRGNAINLGYSRGLTVNGCVFHGFAGNCIVGGGDNVSITNSAFYNIDGHAIRIENYTSDFFREQDEFLIKNNYFYDCATEVGGAPHAVVIDDQYVVFEKNTVHKGEGAVCLGNGAYSHEDKVLNNEIYSMVLQRSDVGTIYNRDGRIVGDRVIDGNYIHDFKPLNERLQSSEHQYAIGIYMDDCCSGAEITNNVLFNGAGSGIQIGGGQNHLIEGNVIADMGKTPILTDNRGETWSAWADNPIVPSGNAIINNVSDVELSINSRMAELGTVSGNVTESFDISRYMNLIDKAGCSIQPITKLYNLRGFNKHGAVSTSDGLLLTWEPTVMADEFCVVVAEDEQMENVVLEATVPYNYLLTDIPIGSYYWKVTAINIGNSTGDNWECSDGVSEIIIK